MDETFYSSFVDCVLRPFSRQKPIGGCIMDGHQLKLRPRHVWRLDY